MQTVFDYKPYFPHETFRVGLIGAHSVGKSEVFKQLAKELRMPSISEGVRHVVSAMGYGSPVFVPDKALMQWKTLQFQLYFENQHANFLSDRSTVDNAAYFHHYLGNQVSLKEYRAYMDTAEAQAKKYTHLIYFPIMWEEIQADGFRHTDPADRYAIDQSVQQMIKTFGVGGRTYTITKDDKVDGEGARLNEVLEHLGLWQLIRERAR